jgi:hypothetical protein
MRDLDLLAKPPSVSRYDQRDDAGGDDAPDDALYQSHCFLAYILGPTTESLDRGDLKTGQPTESRTICYYALKKPRQFAGNSGMLA